MGNLANFLLLASLLGTVFFMAQFLQTAQGYQPLASGLRLLPWTATLFLVAPISGALINRIGSRILVAGGMFVQTVGLVWIALIAEPSLPYAGLIAPLIIAGTGASLALPAVQNAVVSAVAPHEIGKASGTFNMLRQLGAAFGVAILAAVFAHFGSFRSPLTFNSGFVFAMVVSAALSFVGAIAGLALQGRSASTGESEKRESLQVATTLEEAAL
jgi:MFS family permease